jgi:outer membrane receptor protein involved in Fe transport/cytochrome oxidase Cu insertion factor (SCO1/SenC/PrrC family)
MNHSVSGALRAGLMASVAFCGVAFASSASAQQASTEVGELVVTGSRIQRPNLEATQPLLVISSERIEAKGQTNLAEAINDSPSSGIPINPIGDQGSFGTGRNYVNLLNLGTNRTLTLVNGRRFVGSNAASLFTGAGAGGQVDLNGIPTGLVNRTERVFGTGGAVYGSDAIGGVVNIITKTRFEGLEVNGQVGLSEYGDAEEYRTRVIGGMSFLDDRLNLMGSYEYNKTEALAFTDRSVTGRQIAFANNPLNTGPSDLIAGSILIQNRRVPEITAGGLPARTGGSALSGILTIADPNSPGGRIAAQFDRAGNLVPYQTGTFYQTSIASGGDGLNLAKLSSLRSPVDRHVASGFATFDVTPKVRIKAEAFASRVESVEPFNQPIYNGSVFGGLSAALRMSTSNPFLSAQAKAAILAQPTALPADTASAGDRIFFLNRASSDIGNNKTEGEGDVYRGVLVAEGEFDLFGRAMNWDVSANRGQSKGSFKSPNIVQSRFLLAIDAVRDSSGAIVCRDVTARANGCAPLNLFGEGAPSKAALDYVGVQFQSDFQIDQTVYQANFGGSLFDLPAGALGFNVGYEFRQEESDFKPNEPQRTGVGRSAAIAALSGEFETSEFYGELSAPLFGGDFTFLGMQGLEVEERVGLPLPMELQFTTSDGRLVQLGDYFKSNKPAVIAMVYYKCPVVCDIVMQRLTQSFSGMDYVVGEDFNALYFSFDSSETVEDAAAAKRGHLSNYGKPVTPSIEAGWQFHLADADSARQLADALEGRSVLLAVPQQQQQQPQAAGGGGGGVGGGGRQGQGK